jgi:hypothetical protein
VPTLHWPVLLCCCCCRRQSNNVVGNDADRRQRIVLLQFVAIVVDSRHYLYDFDDVDDVGTSSSNLKWSALTSRWCPVKSRSCRGITRSTSHTTLSPIMRRGRVDAAGIGLVFGLSAVRVDTCIHEMQPSRALSPINQSSVDLKKKNNTTPNQQ